MRLLVVGWVVCVVVGRLRWIVLLIVLSYILDLLDYCLLYLLYGRLFAVGSCLALYLWFIVLFVLICWFGWFGLTWCLLTSVGWGGCYCFKLLVMLMILCLVVFVSSVCFWFCFVFCLIRCGLL